MLTGGLVVLAQATTAADETQLNFALRNLHNDSMCVGEVSAGTVDEDQNEFLVRCVLKILSRRILNRLSGLTARFKA